MTKLLKFEMRKLLRSRLFLVCSLILSLIIIVSLLTIAELTKANLQEVQFGKDNQGMTLSVAGEQEYSGKYILVSVLSGQLPLILSVFIPFFVATDFSQGIVQHTITKRYSREKIFLSKLFIIFISTFFFAFISMAIACTLGTILWGFGGKIDINLCVLLLTQFIVVFALSCLYMLISVVFRKTGTAVMVSVLSMTIIKMFFSLLANVFNKPQIEEYHITTSLSNISDLNISKEMILKALIVSVIYILVSNTVSFWYLKTRDV